MLDDPKKIDPDQVVSQTLEELLGRRLVKSRGGLAVLYGGQILVQLAVRNAPLEAMHVELLTGKLDRADPALGLEPEKVAPIHPLACVIWASIVAQHLSSKDPGAVKKKPSRPDLRWEREGPRADGGATPISNNA